jgi:hypothetical protein
MIKLHNISIMISIRNNKREFGRKTRGLNGRNDCERHGWNQIEYNN